MEKIEDSQSRYEEDRQRKKQSKKAKKADIKRALTAAREDEWAEEQATILARTNHDRIAKICQTDALGMRRFPSD